MGLQLLHLFRSVGLTAHRGAVEWREPWADCCQQMAWCLPFPGSSWPVIKYSCILSKLLCIHMKDNQQSLQNVIPPFPYLPALSVGENGRCSLTSVQPLKCCNERPIRPFQPTPHQLWGCKSAGIQSWRASWFSLLFLCPLWRVIRRAIAASRAPLLI